MSLGWTLPDSVSLSSDRIPALDGARQQRTVEEILRRLDGQPGVVLADEVGMGKTFVALAVAVAAVRATRGKRPVVVMVPSSVHAKWPMEWQVFQQTCMPNDDGPEIRATATTVRRGAEFLRLLDDPPARRNHIIFVTHGAMHRTTNDPWVQLLLVRRAFLRRSSLAGQRESFVRWASDIIRFRPFRSEEFVRALMDRHPRHWNGVIEQFKADPVFMRLMKDKREDLIDDDPIPEVLLDPVDKLDNDAIAGLLAALGDLPLRESANRARRIAAVRALLRVGCQEAFAKALSRTTLRLPLLILDEAHHARHAHTKLAKLLTEDQGGDSGAFAGAFERMLFLTATPFQLGHQELVRVLDRFDSVRWPNKVLRAEFAEQRAALRDALDVAQASAQRLQDSWGRLRPADVAGLPEHWWNEAVADEPASVTRAREHVIETRRRFDDVQQRLAPWVIRHLKDGRDERRTEHPGQQILDPGRLPVGLEVTGGAVLPFLLAARAQGLISAQGARGGTAERALFAEGLSSSFEAYRHTRTRTTEAVIDEDGTGSDEAAKQPTNREVLWYLEQIDTSLPDDAYERWGTHPKVSATVDLALRQWERREKLLIFCFYVATGRALRDHIASAIDARIIEKARVGLGLAGAPDDRVSDELDRLADQLFAERSLGTAAQRAMHKLVGPYVRDPDEEVELVAVGMRFLRTRSFLVRDVDLSESDRGDAVMAALQADNPANLGSRIRDYAERLAKRTPGERRERLEALGQIVTGTRPAGNEADDPSADDTRGIWLPDVRLANGRTLAATRQRLLLAFNSPFLPDVLIASAVMSEGVDLQHYCRHVVHHDGDWNPSVLEQRTGRVDRIGSLAEREGKPVRVYEPFLAGTQDEKQYRVVKDRARWFSVVMGAKLELDEASTDKAAQRVPLPAELAAELSLDLSVAAELT